MEQVAPRPRRSEEFYIKVPVALAIRGRYHELAKFFYNISRLERAINMEDIELSTSADSEARRGVSSRSTCARRRSAGRSEAMAAPVDAVESSRTTLLRVARGARAAGLRATRSRRSSERGGARAARPPAAAAAARPPTPRAKEREPLRVQGRRLRRVGAQPRSVPQLLRRRSRPRRRTRCSAGSSCRRPSIEEMRLIAIVTGIAAAQGDAASTRAASATSCERGDYLGRPKVHAGDRQRLDDAQLARRPDPRERGRADAAGPDRSDARRADARSSRCTKKSRRSCGLSR